MSRDTRSQGFRALNMPVSHFQIQDGLTCFPREDDAKIRFIPHAAVVLYPAVNPLARIQEEDSLMPMDLGEAYQDVLDRFNNVDYEGLLGVFDPDIILKRVLNPHSIVGIGNVEPYLRTHMAPHKPSLQKIADLHFHQASATYAYVSGTGDYYDDATKPPTRVRFTWSFSRDDKTEEWSLINAFAAPLS
jgi:hypothetical protein